MCFLAQIILFWLQIFIKMAAPYFRVKRKENIRLDSELIVYTLMQSLRHHIEMTQ